MTDLQISLMVIGGAIVVAVVSYNKWHEYKAKKTVERAFSTSHDDVLMESPSDINGTGGGRFEPSFDAAAASITTTDAADQVDTGSTASAAAETMIGPASTLPSLDASITPKILPVDSLVDCVIPLKLATPIRGEKVIATIQSLRHVGNKPVNFVGQNTDGEWEAITHGATYVALMAGVQLANRNTPLNEIEFSEMVMRLRQLADDLDADPDIPNMTSVMQSAKALHQFVGQYDAQLSANIQSKNTSWPINTLLAALERQGFDVRPDGRLVMSDGEGGNLFSLSTNVTLAAESTSRLTLLLDVPCVAPERDGFGAMSACARSLAHRLDGTVVDDGDQPLSEAALADIGVQVKSFYDEMQAAEVPAGSIRALRLFS
jgi:hypothetical protein